MERSLMSIKEDARQQNWLQSAQTNARTGGDGLEGRNEEWSERKERKNGARERRGVAPEA